MRTEAKQKLSLIVLRSVLVYSLAGLVAIVLVLLNSDGQSLFSIDGSATVVVLAFGIGFLGLKVLGQSGCRFLDSSMVIERPFGPIHIDYDSVSRVERVTRRNGGRKEKVRVTFERAGRGSVFSFTPESPELVVSELVSRCPRLKGSKTHRLKRDPSFRVAIAGTANPPRRRRSPEVEW